MLCYTVIASCPLCGFRNYETLRITNSLMAVKKKCGIESDGGFYGCGKTFLIEAIVIVNVKSIILETVKGLYKKKKGNKK